ncbi:hypothetical protein K435DRAFT_308127 [Dendrothele bispora CBS 962.96]|uniref:BTB domain-containing protein n=1 Tax=Dendrothele bispora (strain CBS 962.96) TaxID=1314807 RepID=A0A4S8LHL8_DENBC|nr:hypothetical protein K435DRAFT_308127 [Dendrothele bispora CBS 962.96]
MFMSSYTPRPFPPHSLIDVPLEYILDQLHNLAPDYWNQTESADCTIVIPVPIIHCKNVLTAPRASYDPSGLGRRVTEPASNLLPRITMKLHSDYLSAQSSLLRALFAGASPLDLVQTPCSPSSPPTPSSGPHSPLPPPDVESTYTIPPNLIPRVLPSSTADHPVLLLPVPDPSSIEVLIHWIYFGRTEFIEDALDNGDIEWEGIARNVEYLGLSTDIKIFLGWWYGRWRHPSRSRMRSAYPWDRYPHTAYSIYASACHGQEIEWNDSDTACSDDDDDDDDEEDDGSDEGQDIFTDDDCMSDTVEDVDMELSEDYPPSKNKALGEEEPRRGRSRTTKGLSWPLDVTEQQRQLHTEAYTELSSEAFVRA